MSAETVPEPLDRIVSVITIVSAIIGALTTAGKFFGFLAGLGTVGGGLLGGFVAAVATLVVIATYLVDRCNATSGLEECVAGVVSNVVQAFSGTLEEIFPFTAMHDRIDLVVKSNYWDVVEDNGAFVHCTEEAIPRRSEIARCYYFTDQVCNAARGAMVGGSIGAIGGVLAAAAIVAAIGCATVVLCIIALIVAALAAAAATLAGAFIGGQIGKGPDTSPTDETGVTIATGDLLSARGNLLPRGFDDNANVLWWVEESRVSGRVADSVPNDPFSYCEINDEFSVDGCLGAIIVE